MENTEKEKRELDEYEQALEKHFAILQECQSKNSVDSCMKCEKILECEIRDEYIKAVYMSMNKGVTGGFEF